MWFKPKKEIVLSPKLCFAVTLLYMASVDGYIENNEMTYLSTVMHGDVKTIQEANKYITKATKKGESFDDFLVKSKEILSDEQKECLIINLIDMMFSDGEGTEDEEKFLFYVMDNFNFDKNRYEEYKKIIIKKNNYHIFK